MYHVKEGLYVEQGPDGSVRVHVFQDDATNAQKIIDYDLTAEEWQSLIGAMDSDDEPLEIDMPDDVVPLIEATTEDEPVDKPIARRHAVKKVSRHR